MEIDIDHNLILPISKRGHKAIIKKTKEKTKPKLLFELIFISVFFNLN